MTSPPPPIVLGPFRLVHVLASGGMGVVWRGVHRSTGLPVAVKLLRAQSGRRRERHADALLAEVRTIARLSHPNIVQVLDFGLVADSPDPERIPEGSPWMALELVEGGAVMGSPPDWDATRRLLIDVLEGLAHAHARGVLHRDVKPDNVLIARDGHGRLTDFGLAAIDTGDRVAWSASGGTLAYAAPEQLASLAEEQGPWTDLYALGGLAWALVTGRTPRDTTSPDPLAALYAPRPPWTPRFPIPADLRAWCVGLMAARTVDRPRSAAEARSALLALEAPESDRPVGTPVPLDVAITWQMDEERDRAAVPEPEGGAAYRFPVPAIPSDWRRGEPALPRRMRDVGLAVGAYRLLPTVGREAVQEALWSALVAVDRGREPAVQLITGPPGSGRTHLVQWLGERAHEAGCLVLHGPAGPSGAALLGRALRIGEGRAHNLRALLGRRLPAWDEARITALMRLLRPEDDAGRLPVADARLVVAETIAAIAEGRTVVAALDDVHRDPAAPGVALALRSVAGPVLIVATAPDAAGLGPLVQLGTEHALERLGSRETRQLIDCTLPLSSDLAARLEARTGGHPGLAVEIVRGWMRDDLLVARTGGFGLAGPVPDDLPASLADVARGRIRAALARNPEDRRVLTLAALLGRRLSFATLRDAAGGVGETVSDAQIARWLTTRLLEVDPEGGWRFCDVVVAHVLADEAEDPERLHIACARALPPGAAHDLRRGRHLLEAGRPAEAIDALAEGAVHQAHLGREGEALEAMLWMARALDAIGDPSDRRYIRCYAGMARFHRTRRSLDEARSALARARDHVARWFPGDAAAIGEIALATAEVNVDLHAFEAALEVLDDALVSGAPQRDRIAVIRALALLGLGRFDAALDALDGAEPDDPSMRAIAAYVAGEALSEVGHLADAEAVLRASFETRVAQGERVNSGGAGITLTMVTRQRGALQRALHTAERTVAVLEGAALHWIHAAWLQRGLVHLQMGNDAAARADLERAAREDHEGELGLLTQLGLAVVAARRGDHDAASDAIARIPPPDPHHAIRRAEVRDALALADEVGRLFPALYPRISEIVDPLQFTDHT